MKNNLIQIGTMLWSNQNFKELHFANGEAIPLISSKDEWMNASRNHDPCAWEMNGEVYYNHYALSMVNDIIPKGFRMPSDEDWKALVSVLDDLYGPGMNVAGKVLSARRGELNVGFNNVWGGMLQSHTAYEFADFIKEQAEASYYWTKTESYDQQARKFYLNKKTKEYEISSSPRGCGMLVRLILEG
jgi:uncharacterized protein (TIGR02145 family)